MEVTRDLCEAKHSEINRSLEHIETKLDDALLILRGNGRPGLRQTQADLDRLASQIAAERAKRDSWIMLLVRPILPIIYGIALAAMYVQAID